jgi:hypothetical protein
MANACQPRLELVGAISGKGWAPPRANGGGPTADTGSARIDFVSRALEPIMSTWFDTGRLG